MANKVSKSFLIDSHLIAELKLCSIRLIDYAKFPWIILIPKLKNITDIAVDRVDKVIGNGREIISE